MHQIREYIRLNARLLGWLFLALVGLAWLMLYRLGTLPGGLSAGEMHAAVQPVGWHGIYHQPLNLPLLMIRSVVFWPAPNHGALLTRLPNVFWGGLAVTSFAWLMWLWHGARTTVLATILFASGAWTLHASRLASFDVLYLWAMPTLLLIQALGQQFKRPVVWYGSLIAWGLMLYIPGMVWLVALSIWLQRQSISQAWQKLNLWWQRSLSVLFSIIWLPLLLIDLSRPSQLAQWVGLPSHLASPLKLLKQLVGVFVHLLVRGPQYPDIWLTQLPILDVFCLVMFIFGGIFYVLHWQAKRSRQLGLFSAVGVVLIALNGSVGLSLLVPVLYMVAATGITYLLHEWLGIFPRNPLARSVGIGLVALAVAVSCLYNYRAYFVAWPHNTVTSATFRYHRP